MKKVIVFGVFDGVHDGHRYFLNEAKKLGDHLTAVVAADKVVEILKGRGPARNIAERIAHIETQDGVDGAVEGDVEIGSWEIVKKLRPDVVALGYDQTELKEDLENSLKDFDWPLKIKIIPAHEPGKYHNSILNGD
ncbi:MAG: adenylyltransferase/cytidyltransferase family protein [Candidatus Liptonbacteria bacterium]|nr:adenylyltransferase/cytidyltransferase family protein [Candidatus Liptonbacteria bacterium]